MSALPKATEQSFQVVPKPVGKRGLKQAYDLRDLAAKQAIALDHLKPSADPREVLSRSQAILALIRAWESASDRIRILKGVPLPGSRRPAPQKPQRQSLKPLAQWNEQPSPTGKTTPIDQQGEGTEETT